MSSFNGLFDYLDILYSKAIFFLLIYKNINDTKCTAVYVFYLNLIHSLSGVCAFKKSR